MKFDILGFELVIVIGFSTTTKTRITYVKLLTNHIRCRMFHNSTWVPKIFDDIQGAGDDTYRWFCCKDCRDVWTQKMTGCGDDV